MSRELLVLLGSAAAIGGGHTLLGPDHYVPFVVLGKARRWSLRKTLSVTALCGVGHVASSVILGLIGIAVGISLRHLELVESTRGEIAAWLLIAFGLAYGSWGAVRAWRGEQHDHTHDHPGGLTHTHLHPHQVDHLHPHDAGTVGLTPWVLFLIFVFGPCEPLIPLLMFPAATLSPWAIALVVVVFGTVTIGVMTSVVFVSYLGLGSLSFERLGRLSHAAVGFTILLCGVAIRLGL